MSATAFRANRSKRHLRQHKVLGWRKSTHSFRLRVETCRLFTLLYGQRAQHITALASPDRGRLRIAGLRTWCPLRASLRLVAQQNATTHSEEGGFCLH